MIPLLRCLSCGATHDDLTRAPDGVDFRSQFTEKGEPPEDDDTEDKDESGFFLDCGGRPPEHMPSCKHPKRQGER